MPFELTNAPTIFMDLINHVFIYALDQYTIIFINGILVYSKNSKEHENHLTRVLEIPCRHQLYTKFSKCSFYLNQMSFLDQMISGEGVYVNPSRLKLLSI